MQLFDEVFSRSMSQRSLQFAHKLYRSHVVENTPWLEGNGYETRQSSLLYVIVLFSGLDPAAQNTIVVYSETRN